MWFVLQQSDPFLPLCHIVWVLPEKDRVQEEGPPLHQILEPSHQEVQNQLVFLCLRHFLPLPLLLHLFHAFGQGQLLKLGVRVKDLFDEGYEGFD